MPANDANAAEAPAEGSGKAGFEPPATQAELDKIIEKHLTAERARYADYDDLKAKAARLDEAEQAGKTELQKAQEKLEAALAENTALKTRALAGEVAAAKKLPAGAAEFLAGATRAELEASADQLLALLAPQTPKAPRLVSAAAPPPESPASAELDFMKRLLEKE